MNDSSISEKNFANPDLQYYVGIDASAGGLEALETLFTNMPPKSGLAFIIIQQHLSPGYKSLMMELLSERTSMSVHRAENGVPVHKFARKQDAHSDCSVRHLGRRPYC